MADTYLDGDILGFNHQDALDARVDTYRRLSPILNPQDAPLLDAKFADVLTSVGNGPSRKVDGAPQIDIGAALVSDDPVIKANALAATQEILNQTPEYKFSLGRTIESPVSEYTEKFMTKDWGYSALRDNENFYYQNDYMADGAIWRNVKNVGRFIGRVIPQTALKLGQGLGYLGSMITSIGSNNYWADVADNGLSKWLTEAEQHVKDQWIPVYKQAGFDEKGFFSKLVDWSFWNESVADGVAFMASAFVPGMGIAKLGTLGKFGQAFSKTSLLGRAASKVSMGSWAEVTSWTVNTAMESAHEGAGVFKNVKRQLEEDRDLGLNNLTDEEIRERAGKMAANTIGGNFAVLALSNVWENTLIFKPFKGNVGRAGAEVTETLGGRNVNLSQLDKTGVAASLDLTNPMRRLRHYGGGAAKAFVAEGLWEENAQLAIQRINEGNSEGGFWSQLVGQTQEAFFGEDTKESRETAESIGLGTIIGIGASTVISKATGERKKLIENARAAVDEINSAKNRLFSTMDIYQRDSDGKLVYDEKTNSVKIDPVKMAAKEVAIKDVFEGISLAGIEGFETSSEMKFINRRAVANYVRSVLQAGGENVVDRLRNLSPEVAESMGLDPKEINKHAAELASIAERFTLASNNVDELRVSVPSTATTLEKALAIETIRSEMYRAQTDNAIMSDLLAEENTKFLSGLNAARSLNNASLAEFPVDQLNTLIAKIKANRMVMESKRFENMSEVEQQYHKDRQSQLESELELAKTNNEVLLQDTVITKNGYYRPTRTLPDGTKEELKFPSEKIFSNKTIANYENVMHKNQHIIDMLSDMENNYNNFLKWNAKKEQEKIEKEIKKEEAKSVTKKYREQNPGDFNRVAALVAKLVFGDNKTLSPEEEALQATYKELVDEMIPQYEAKANEYRQNILKSRLASIRKEQEVLQNLIGTKEKQREKKQSSLEALQEELQKEANGKRANQKKIQEAITKLTQDIQALQAFIDGEQAKLDAINKDIEIVENEIQNGNFRQLADQLNALTAERNAINEQVRNSTALLDQLKKLLGQIRRAVYKLYGNKAAYLLQLDAGNQAAIDEANRIADTETTINTLNKLIPQLIETYNNLTGRVNAINPQIIAVITQVNNFFRQQYLDTTKQKAPAMTAEEKKITEGLTSDKGMFPQGAESKGVEADETSGFDGSTYQRPLSTKFYTTTFPRIDKDVPWSTLPQEVQDYFEFVNFVTEPANGAEVRKKLGKNGKLQMLIVTKNNVKELGLQDVIDKDIYFKERNAGMTHFEIIPVINDGGVLYYVDSQMNRLGEVKKKKVSDNIVRTSLRTVKFTKEEEEQYFGKNGKYTEQDKKLAVKEAIDWRTGVLSVTAKTPVLTYDFEITRGLPNRMYNQDGTIAANPVEANLIPDGKITYDSVRVYSTNVATINGQNIQVPPGRPFIYTTNGVHEQLHAANNQKLTTEQVNTVTAVFKAFLADHLERVTNIIEKDAKFPAPLKARVEKVGGLQNADDALKNDVYLAVTSMPSAKGKLFNNNYTNFLSSIVYFSQILEKDKTAHPNQIFIRGFKLRFGWGGPTIDITSPEGMDSAPIQDFLNAQHHNIKYIPGDVKKKKEYLEYHLEDGELEVRSWPTYSHYLLSASLPDGTPRDVIPITTSVKTTEQRQVDQNQPSYPYISRGIMLYPPTKTTITKKKPQEDDIDEEEEDEIEVISEKQVFKGSGKDSSEPLEELRTEDTKGASKMEELRRRHRQKKGEGAEDAKGASILEELRKRRRATKEEVPESEEEEDISPREEPDEVREEQDEFNDDLFRVSKGGMFKTEEDLDAVVKDIQRMLPQFPVYLLKKAIATMDGREAWGQFTGHVIKLYELAEEGTGYHEAFEAVVNRLLSDTEWKSLYSEFKKRNGYFTDRETGERVKYSEASPHQAKEQIAEEFRDFKLKKREFSGQKRNIFQRIWDFIKSLFTNKDAIETVFDKIDKGKYKDRTPLTQNRFGRNYRLKGIKAEARHDLFEGATAAMFRYIFHRPGSLSEIDDIDFNDSQVYEPVREHFNHMIEELNRARRSTKDQKKLGQYKQAAANIQYALDNWAEFVADHKMELRKFRIKFEEDVAPKQEDQDLRNRNDYAFDHFKTDGKLTASKSIRFLFGTLIQHRFNSNGRVKMVNDLPTGDVIPIRNSTSMGRVVHYDEWMLKALDEFSGLFEWNRIEERMKELAGIVEIEATTDPAAREKLISEMSEEKATWTSLYNRIFGFSDKVDEEAAWNLKVKLQSYVSKQLPNPHIAVTKGGSLNIISSVNRGFYESTVRKVEDSLRTNMNIAFIRKMKAGTERFSPNKMYKEPVEPSFFTFKRHGSKFQSIQLNDFIKLIGMQEYITPDLTDALTERERSDLALILLRIRNEIPKKTETMALTIAELDINNYTNSLIQFLDDKLSLANKGSQFYNFENELQARHVPPSFISRIISEINSVKTLDELHERFPQTATAFAEDSILLSKMFDEDGNRVAGNPLTLDYVEGLKDRDDDAGTKSSRLELHDLYYLHFNSSLRGIYHSLPADSETEWAFNMGEFVSYSENMLKERGTDIINKIFLPKLRSEINMAQAYNSRAEQYGAIHESTGRPAGASLRFFKDILKSESDPTLVKEIHDLIAQNTPAEQIIMGQMRNRIRRAIAAHLTAQVAQQVEFMKEHRLAIVDEDGGAIMTGIETQFLAEHKGYFSPENGTVNMTKVQFESLLAYQKINSMIANMEAFKIIFGDPAQYKDWEKRAKSMFSPYEPTFNDKDGIFNQWLEKNKNSATLPGEESVELSPEDWFRQSFGNIIRSRTINDFFAVDTDVVNTINETGSEFAKSFVEEYEKVNETDGQSIGTLGFARHLMIKSGWRWSNEHERYFQYDTALMRQELSALPNSHPHHYTYTNNALRDLDKKIVEFYKTNPPNAALTPVKTLMPSVSSTGEMILLKHSVHFMSYQVAKEFELLDRYVDMLKNNEDLLNFKSAQKVGVWTDAEGDVTNYYKDPFTKNDLDGLENPVFDIDMRNIGVQVETQGTAWGQTIGTQVTKLSNLNLLENGVPTDFRLDLSPDERYEQWEQMDEEDRLDSSEKYRLIRGENGTITTLENLKTKSALDAFDRLGIQWKYDEEKGFTYEVDKLDKLREYIENEVTRLGADRNTIDNLDLTEDLKAFRHPAETVPSYTVIANVLWALADKSVARMKVNGKPMVLVSTAFFNKESRKAAYKENGKWITVNTKEEYDAAVAAGKKLTMTSSELKFYRKGENGETLGMEVYLPHFYKQKVNDKRIRKGLAPLTDEQLMEYLNENPKLLEGVGFRIPSQATSSIDFFTVKGFLPESFGSSIIVPSAITTKQGSDFDVDKLNTYINNWRLNHKGLPVYEEFKDNGNSGIDERYVLAIKEKEKQYREIYAEMKGSSEWKDVEATMIDNNNVVAATKELINPAASEAEAEYYRGLEIFSKLPISIKQQYYAKNRELNDDEIDGVEKIMAFIPYTNQWLKTFESGEALVLEVQTKSMGPSQQTVRPQEAVPHLQEMVNNYYEFLKLNGVTRELIEEYLALKAERREENDRLMRNYRLKLAKIIAEFNGYISYDEFGKLPMYLQNGRKALENRYFDAIRNILKHPDNYEYLLSPNSIEHLKQNRNEVYDALDREQEDKQELNYTRFISTEYIAEKRNQFTKGKYDIGIFAIAMTNYANSQVTGIGMAIEGGYKKEDRYIIEELNNSSIILPFEDVEYAPLTIKDEFGEEKTLMIPISKLRDKDGKLTMDKLSAYINGAVDVAKDPIIIDMGMHTELAGVYTLLERMGLRGKTVALFMYQPAIREFLKEIIHLERRSYAGYSGYMSRQEIIDELTARYIPKGFKFDEDYRFSDADLVKGIQTGEKIKKSTKYNMTQDEKTVQYYALINFLKVKVFADHLRESIMSSNHDTAGIRNPHIMVKKDLQFERAKRGNMTVKSTADGIKNGAEAIREETSVGTDIKMLRQFDGMYSRINLFALRRDNPSSVLAEVARRIYRQNPYITDDDFIGAMREYESAMIDSIVHDGVVPGTPTKLYQLAKQLFVTTQPNSLKKRFLAIKNRYPEYSKKNFFLNNLEINSNPSLGIDMMELKVKPSNTDVTTKEMITEAMEALAEVDSTRFPDIVDFYRAMIYGAFIQFGMKFTRQSFLDLIPVSASNPQAGVLTLTDLTSPALDRIDTEDFYTFDELVQRSKWYRKGVVAEQKQMTMHTLIPTEEGTLAFEPKARWRSGDKTFPLPLTSQTFFGIQNQEKEWVPSIHPALISGGFGDRMKLWEEMPDIIAIRAIKPEFIRIRIETDQYGNQYKKKTVAKEVYEMMKKNNHDYSFTQLYKKVGLEDRSFARASETKTAKGEEGVAYLYKPIHKSGARGFGEMNPLEVTEAGTTVGVSSIVKHPKFNELEDSELVGAIDDTKGKTKLFMVFEPDMISEKIKAPVYKPKALKNKKALKDRNIPTMTMAAEAIIKVVQGTKTTTVRTENQAEKVGIKTGDARLRYIGGILYKVTNRGLMSIQEAGGLEAILQSEGIDPTSVSKYPFVKEWIEGKRKLYVYDIEKFTPSDPDNPLDCS